MTNLATRIRTAVQFEQAGQAAQAHYLYANIVKDYPSCDQAWHGLGLLALQHGNLPQAISFVEAAIASNQKISLYHRNIGEMYRRHGQLEKAVAACKRARSLTPNDLDTHYNLALAYTEAKDFAKAVKAYEAALRLDERHGLSWNNLGSALEQRGDKQRALAAYQRAVQLNPAHAEAQNNLGAMLSEIGQLDDARSCFEQALAAMPHFVEAHYNLSALKTYTPADPHLAMLEGLHGARERLSTHARIRYCFAIGKALEDTADYDRAYASYAEGNQLQHQLQPTDEARADLELDRIIAIFTKEFFAARAPSAAVQRPDRRPVFIVGMPRSGTTLLEQILSSHGAVYGAGELSHLHNAVQAALPDPGRPFADGVQCLDAAQIQAIGEEYMRRVWQLAPEATVITDKMPANFFYLGVLHLALPNARIIHSMRDPMDSCFSCYARLFNSSMAFAYDQGTLGRYYVRYMKLMQHWQRVLPPGTILDLAYEDMVADTEQQARRVLAFVGLPWEPRCLEFYNNARLVKTASMAQVRRPIYSTSVARWKHFARHLGPLHAIVHAWRDAHDAPAGLQAGAAAVTPAAHGAQALHVAGIGLYKQGHLDQALACYEQALRMRPDFAEALNSYGFVLQDLGRLEQALRCYTRALELAPQLATARLNLGMLQLKLGLWQAGWENYEARWTGSAEAGSGVLVRPACPLPQWHGEPGTQSKSLLVITEQGYGDTFQFARFLLLAAARFAKVGFVCSQPTRRLMEWAWGERILTFTRLPDGYATWDLQCPLMSLPRAFGITPDSLGGAVPYLQAPAPARTHWRERLDLAAAGCLRVGLAWAGRRAHQADGRRSLRFDQLGPLWQDLPVCWVSLQKIPPGAPAPVVPAQVRWIDWTDELTDFADTAALVANLDLVISIDSSMVHLAGAFHRPVWMMNRFDSEWRWFTGRNDSPWYPSLRIFNQPALGDWNSVLADVAQALRALCAARTDAAPPPRALPAETPQAASIPAACPTTAQTLQMAAHLHATGRWQEAETRLTTLLQVEPANAHAVHLLGLVAWSAGRQQPALDLLGQAIALDAEVALFHSNLAEMYRQSQQRALAIEHGKRAIALDPSLALAYVNLGIAWYDARQYGQAERCHQKALQLVPGLATSLNNLGSIARVRKDLPQAISWYRQALNAQPDYLEAMSNLAAVLLESGDARAAEHYASSVLAAQPQHPDALCNLGLLRTTEGRLAEAENLLTRALQVRPNYAEALVGLAAVYGEQERLAEAVAALDLCLQHCPDLLDAWIQLGARYTESGDQVQADTAYCRALALDPGNSDALLGLANLRLEQGAMQEARRMLEQAITQTPDHLGARFHLVQARKVTPGDANLAGLEQLLLGAAGLPREKCICLHYALGMAYDDLQQWERAFVHFLEGARLKRATLDYDADCDAARVQQIIARTSGQFLQRLGPAGDPSQVPVFVLGMPRSGTTLVEQIIASHPLAHGAGELRDLFQLLEAMPSENDGALAFPESLSALTPETVAELGAAYVRRLRARAPDALRITDKMPANYLLLGLIPLLLPHAKIIHVKRDPVDTCVSCFTRLFNRHQDATYDLRELGMHYANYARLMQHWRSILPATSFMEVHYEDVVADIEGQARRLIDGVGLPWNDACLEFYKTSRSVRTASVAQVRQPIYSSSVGRWRHYEKFLSPLFEALAEFAPRGDLDTSVRAAEIDRSGGRRSN